jgi:hypothetical protein
MAGCRAVGFPAAPGAPGAAANLRSMGRDACLDCGAGAGRAAAVPATFSTTTPSTNSSARTTVSVGRAAPA